MDALFEADGHRFVPSELTRGPWDVAAQHGGPPSALATRALERMLGESVAIARVTIDLVRPVPLEPLLVDAEVVRSGRTVRLAEASMQVAATGKEVLRARCVGFRIASVELPDDVPSPDQEPPPENDGAPYGVRDVPYVGFKDAVALTLVEGSAEQGPSAAWVRLLGPLVNGEEPSGAQRAVIAADFSLGFSNVLPFDRYRYPNADLTVHLLRPPVGDAICVRAVTAIGSSGAGMAEAALFDETGRVGRSCQSLLVESR